MKSNTLRLITTETESSRLMMDEPKRHGDYRDYLRGPNRRSREWIIERTMDLDAEFLK